MTTATASRCAAHPARRAVDGCPVCGRERCGADAAGYGETGCPSCASSSPAAPLPGLVELVVRAGLAGLAVAFVGGWIGTQYVRNRGFSLIAPALVGIAIAWTVAAVSSHQRRRLTSALAAVAAVLSAALAFRIYAAGGLSPLHPAGRVLPPYAAAIAGVLVWPLLFGPVKRRTDDEGP